MTRLSAILSVWVVSIGIGPASAALFMSGDIADPDQAANTGANSGNNTGIVTGYYSAADGTRQRFTYQGSTYSAITLVGGATSRANALSDTGTITSPLTSGSGAFGILGGSAVNTAGFTGATGLNEISRNELTVIGFVARGMNYGRAASGHGTTFEVLPSGGTSDISPPGAIDIPSAGGAIDIPSAGGASADASAIAGRYSDGAGTVHAFTLDGSISTSPDDPLSTYANIIPSGNSPSDLSGYFINASKHASGFVSSNGSFVSVKVRRANGRHAVPGGVTAGGTVLTDSIDPDSDQTTENPTAAPEPSSITVLGVSLIGLIGYRRARRSRSRRATWSTSRERCGA